MPHSRTSARHPRSHNLPVPASVSRLPQDIHAERVYVLTKTRMSEVRPESGYHTHPFPVPLGIGYVEYVGLSPTLFSVFRKSPAP